jgi:O-acetyl-ADP-ribose deacetylase (regulator of RNase III)
MIKIIAGDICYPKSQALIIPANSKGIMSRGNQSLVAKAAQGNFIKEVKEFTTINNVDLGDCFSTGPGRLKRRGVKKVYHAVIKKLQNDFTSIYFVRKALHKSLLLAQEDMMESVTICGIGINPGELDPESVAMITYKEAKKFENKLDIKIIDGNIYFIKVLESLS